jgi:hypothetical protein
VPGSPSSWMLQPMAAQVSGVTDASLARLGLCFREAHLQSLMPMMQACSGAVSQIWGLVFLHQTGPAMVQCCRAGCQSSMMAG